MIVFRWYPVLIGAAAGVGIAALLSIGLWAALALTGITEDITGPILLGVLAGIAAGGYVAGRLGDRGLYQGGMAGLAVAAVVVGISLFSGSPASPGQLVAIFAIGLALGMAGGAVAFRHRQSYPDEASSPDDRGPRPEESPDSTGQDAG